MVATQESINSRFCSVVEIKLSFFSSRVATYQGQTLVEIDVTWKSNTLSSN